MEPYLSYFFLGLLSGGITCAALQGGLLALIITPRSEDRSDRKTPRSQIVSVSMVTALFLIAKLTAYALLGGLLGRVGEGLLVTNGMIAFGMAIAGIVMILSVIPLMKKPSVCHCEPSTVSKIIQPVIDRLGSWKYFFGPVILGLFTIFLPCGTTQAVMLTSVSSGNPFYGSGILTAFTIGTMPAFVLLAFGYHAVNRLNMRCFRFIAGIGIIVLVLWNLSHIPTVLGYSWDIKNGTHVLFCQIAYCDEEVSFDGKKVNHTPTTTPLVLITNSGYSIENAVVPAGKEITLTIRNVSGNGCMNMVTIPSIGYRKNIAKGTEETVIFTAGKKGDKIVITCSMGMYKTILEIR